MLLFQFQEMQNTIWLLNDKLYKTINEVIIINIK